MRERLARLEDSALSEALGRPSPAPASVSSLPGELGRARARVCSYMRESLAADGGLLPIDGHRILSAPGGSDLAELGYDSKARFRPQPDLTCAFSAGNDGAAPAYYKRYSGGTADVTAFADLVSEAGLLGADCLAVADEGFASEEDFALLGELGLSCVVPPGRGDGFRGAGSRWGPPAGATPSRTTGAGPAA